MSLRKHPTAIAALVASGLLGACFVSVPELVDGTNGAPSGGAPGSGGTAGGGFGGDAGDADSAVPPDCVKAHFVASDGDDVNDGTEAQPWKTLEQVRKAALSPGDCVLLRRGDAWTSALDVGWSGTQDERIVVGAYGVGDAPVLRQVWIQGKAFVTLRGLRVSGSGETGVIVFDSEGISLEDCEIDHAGFSNLAVKNSRDVLLQGVSSHDALVSGLDVYSAEGGVSQDIVIEGSRFHGNGDAGITITSVSGDRVLRPIVRRSFVYENRQGISDLASDDALYHHNVFYSQGSAVFTLKSGQPDPGDSAARNARIFNNVFYNPTTLEWSSMLLVGSDNSGIVVKNNVFVGNVGAQFVVVETGGDASLDHNVYHGGGTLTWHGASTSTLVDWRAASAQDLNSWMEEPSFADPPSDLHVLSNSPCLDTGVDVGLTQDIDGDGLPQGAGFDIGVQDQ
jgi:hypothetical protein